MNKRSHNDTRWADYNQKLTELMKKGSFFELKTTYYQMAEFVEAEGRDGAYLREKGYIMGQKHHKKKLEDYAGIGIEKVEIFANKESCSLCLEQNGKVLYTDEALESMPLPVEECNHAYGFGCRCTYLPCRSDE